MSKACFGALMYTATQSRRRSGEIVLSLDELAEKEGENWVWKDTQYSMVVQIALTMRTFASSSSLGEVPTLSSCANSDLIKKQFVADNAFTLPEAKSRISYVTRDQVYVGTDFAGDGKSLTRGYPRVVKLWHRGQS